jgi:hypothetical protein
MPQRHKSGRRRNKVTDLNSQILGTKPRKKAIHFQTMLVVRIPTTIRDRLRVQAQGEAITMSRWIRRTLEAKLRRK